MFPIEAVGRLPIIVCPSQTFVIQREKLQLLNLNRILSCGGSQRQPRPKPQHFIEQYFE
jgi:hypothetical protein